MTIGSASQCARVRVFARARARARGRVRARVCVWFARACERVHFAFCTLHFALVPVRAWLVPPPVLVLAPVRGDVPDCARARMHVCGSAHVSAGARLTSLAMFVLQG